MLESDACCCFLDGWSEMVELWVAVAQLAEEHVSNNHRNLMISKMIDRDSLNMDTML